MRYIIEHLLRFLSRRIIKKYDPDIVGITGSTGKTRVKDMVVRILQGRFRVVGSTESCGARLGLPLAIIGRKPAVFFGWISVIARALKLCLTKNEDYPDVFVFEMSATKPGDLKYLTDIAPCQVGVVISAMTVDSALNKTVRKIVQENRWMVSQLPKTGFAVLNRDEDEVFQMAKKTEADVITFGFHSEADVRASDVGLKAGLENPDCSSVIFKVTYKGGVVPFHLPVVQKEQDIYYALAATAVALIFGMNLVEISRILKEA